MVKLFASNITLFSPAAFQKMEQLLPVSRLDRAKEMKNSNDQKHRILADTLIHYFLQKNNFSESFPELIYSQHGKPVFKQLPKVEFNLSHSGDWVVAAFADTAVGVDVENSDRKAAFEVANRFFSSEEQALINSCHHLEEKRALFFKLWTAKESYLKARATGLTKPLNSFSITFTGSQPTISEPKGMEKVSFTQNWVDQTHIVASCSLAGEKTEPIHRVFPDEIFSLLT